MNATYFTPIIISPKLQFCANSSFPLLLILLVIGKWCLGIRHQLRPFSGHPAPTMSQTFYNISQKKNVSKVKSFQLDSKPFGNILVDFFTFARLFSLLVMGEYFHHHGPLYSSQWPWRKIFLRLERKVDDPHVLKLMVISPLLLTLLKFINPRDVNVSKSR